MEGFRAPGMLLAVPLALAVDAAPVQYPPAEPGVSFDAVLRLPAAEPSAVYPYGDAAPQFAELWLPRGDADVPVVAFVHGGCWLNQYGIDHARPLATALAQDGFAVWNIEYRRLGDPGGGWPGSLEDIRAALTLLARLDLPRLDLSRLALAGHSAGGHLALLAASDLPGDLAAGAVLGLAPITDIAAYASGEGSCNRAAKQFLGPEPGAELLAAANPAARPAPPGTVLLMGREDAIVPYAIPALVPHTLVGVEAGHFDWIHPGTPAWQRFRRELGEVLQ